MASEQSGAAMQTVGETMVNRASAWGKSLGDIVGNQRYYEPYQNRSFYRNLEQLQRDPEKLRQITQMQDAILSGSNRSNLATHNASAGVAARARVTQTVASAEAGETYTRKDINPVTHGPGVVRKEREWYERTIRAMRGERGGEAARPLAIATRVKEEQRLTAERLLGSRPAEEARARAREREDEERAKTEAAEKQTETARELLQSKRAERNREELTRPPPKKSIDEGKSAGEAAARAFKEGVKEVSIPVKSIKESDSDKQRNRTRDEEEKEAA